MQRRMNNNLDFWKRGVFNRTVPRNLSALTKSIPVAAEESTMPASWLTSSNPSNATWRRVKMKGDVNVQQNFKI